MTTAFAEKLRTLRVLCGLSQSELAHDLSLASHASISHLEAGRKQPSLDLVIRLASVLLTTVDYLIHDEIPVIPPLIVSKDTQRPVVLELSSFGERLYNLREGNKLTQSELARRLGFRSNAYVSYLESGQKTPSIDLVIRTASFFEVTVSYLLFGEVAEQ